MEIISISPQEFENIFSNSYVIFNTARFNQINSYKCDSVKYLLFKDKKFKMGLILGYQNGELLSPFSAPYGGFSAINANNRFDDLLSAVELLDDYAATIGARAIKITLPPNMYNESYITKQASAMLNTGYTPIVMDINSFFILSDFNETYLENIPYSAKKNYKSSVRNCLEFSRVTASEDIKTCYEINKENRMGKGRQLKMSLEEIVNTNRIVPIDYFLVSHAGEGIAGSIIYHVNSDVVQVVYWGALEEKEYLRPLNFMSYHIWDYYKNLGYKIVDIGPSSLYSVPDLGLVNFKESIGCKLSLKLTFRKEFSL